MDSLPPNPWDVGPLSNAERAEKYQQTLTLHVHSNQLARRAGKQSNIVFGLACLLTVCSAAVVTVVIMTKDVKHELWLIDQRTGIIAKPLTIADAAQSMPEASDRKALTDLIMARETWVWETDERRDHIVKIMSMPDEQARYAEWRKSAFFPGRSLGKEGHVLPENLQFHREPDGKGGTRSYKIYVMLTTWRGTDKESSLPYTITVDFQWHPEMAMIPADRDDNPGGFLTLAYTAVSDTPDKRRQH